MKMRHGKKKGRGDEAKEKGERKREEVEREV